MPDSLTWLYVIYSVAITPGHSAQFMAGTQWLSQVQEWDWQLADTQGQDMGLDPVFLVLPI